MNTTDYASWRQELATALTINPNQTFSRRHPALAKQLLLNTSFPDTTILQYYTHPVVSSSEKLATFKPEWKKPDIPVLAKLCRNLFDWEFQRGMVRLMRSITPGLVLWDIVHQTNKDDMTQTQDKSSSSVVPSKTKKSSTRLSEGKAITDYFKPTKSISLPPTKPTPLTSKDSWILGFHGTRKHFSTDNTEELRLSYIPSAIQPYTHLNFNLTAPSIPSQFAPKTPSKRANTSDTSKSESFGESEDDIPGPWAPRWSPDEVARIWIPKVYVQKAVPARLEEWERSEIVRKTPRKKRVGKENGGGQLGAMDQFVRKLGKEQDITAEYLVRGVKPLEKNSGKKSPRKENVNPVKIGNTMKDMYSTPKKDMNDIFSTSKKNTGETYSIPAKNNMVTTIWTLSSSDSDSDPLPSPTSLLTYVRTPKTERTKRRLEQVSPITSRKGESVDTAGKNLRNEGFREDDIVVEEVLAVRGKVLAGFRESLGGTWHEVNE
jgi:Holliday junction resolvase Gen1 C-terminal domain